MGAELGVKGGVLGNERVGVEKDGGGHRTSIYCCTAGKGSGERAPGKQEGMLQPNLDPQPALVTVCLALGVCPPPVFPQQGQGSGPSPLRVGLACYPPPDFCSPPRMQAPSSPPSSFFTSFFSSPLSFSHPLSFLFLFSRCLLSRSLSYHLSTLCPGLISVTLLSPQNHTKTTLPNV